MFDWEWVQAVRERRRIEEVLHEACNLVQILRATGIQGFQLVWFCPAVMTLKKAGASSGSIGMRRK